MYQKIKKHIEKSDNFYSLGSNVLYTLFSVITFFLMVRLLNLEIYGRWIIYITVASLLDMFRLGLTGTAAIRLISTANSTDRKLSIAASYQLSLFFTLVISSLFLTAYFLLNPIFPDSYYLPVLLYYPVLALANTSFNQATTLSQGIVKFKRVLVLKGINGGSSFLFIGSYILFTEVTLQGIILMHIFANALSSLFSILKKWDGLEYFFHFDKRSISKILNFGKYATASFVGSNLLRSSDTIIISLSAAMGAEAIAIYAIPLKFIEVVEIPLRSFTATAFPKLSKAFKEGKEKFNSLLSKYILGTSVILIPVLFGLLFFSDYLLPLIGGSQYNNSLELQKSIVHVITIYIIILPFDRYSGVALFALNKPEINFQKILIMLVSNIIFDLIAVFVFQSLILVAFATVIFTLSGILIGWFHIVKESGFLFSEFSKEAGTNFNDIFLIMKI
jgi:O-antigen/teichoic acid export membrane protein